MHARASAGVNCQPGRLWSLWDMLQSYLPIYQIAMDLQALLSRAEMFKSAHHNNSPLPKWEVEKFSALLESIIRKCPAYGLNHTADLAKPVLSRLSHERTYADQSSELIHLNDSLSSELDKEAAFRIPADRKVFFERPDLFGSKVAAAFPSCERDIQKAGSCYAVGQEDACVHHLMLVLERGLAALAVKFKVSHHHTNWQTIINEIESKIKSLSRGPQLNSYRQINAQFGFLKEAYRNHSEHAHDDPYDLEKALHIFNHVKMFMQAIEEEGLAE
jgi:hypothetical protein